MMNINKKKITLPGIAKNAVAWILSLIMLIPIKIWARDEVQE